MKIVVLIPVYKRPEVFKICLENLEWFISKVKWSVEVVCLLSPEDCYLKQNQRLVIKYGFKAIYFKNLPIADKINAGIQWIYRNMTFDYLMNFGSDDLIHPGIEKLYKPYFEDERQFFGINSLYFFDLNTKKTIYFRTYNFNGSIGAGRMIHYSVIKKILSQFVPLYEPGLCQGLDTSSAMTIKRNLNIVDIGIESGTFPYIVDIKTATNINPLIIIEERAKNITESKYRFLKKYYNVL